MRHVVIHVNEAKPRLTILWDNDARDSMSTMPFDGLDRAMSFIAGLVHGFRVEGHDVDILSVSVLNPGDDHRDWVIDWDSDNPNARVIALT